MTMKKPPVGEGGVIICVPAATIATSQAAIRLWHLANAADHLIAAVPECPRWASVALDHITIERERLTAQEVA